MILVRQPSKIIINENKYILLMMVIIKGYYMVNDG